MTILFISDLHLDAERPDITRQFLEFLEQEARHAVALYILGDLFEAWIGDDDPAPEPRRIVAALRALTDSGVACFLLHGNRDFLLGREFCRQTGAKLLVDGSIVTLYGRKALLMHGDALCIDDPAYQRLRRIVRNPIVQFVLRKLSLERRRNLAARMRMGSKAHIAAMDEAAPKIMDVNETEVRRALLRYDVDLLIHGHTHRPAIHDVRLSGSSATRIVLGDWYEQGSVLRWTEDGYTLAGLKRCQSASSGSPE